VAQTCNLIAQNPEFKRIMVRSQPGQIDCETLSQKKPSQKRDGGIAQCIRPEFKPQNHKKGHFCLFKIAIKGVSM
jgi:hypothetical protein